jgi:hypothetical protein
MVATMSFAHTRGTPLGVPPRGDGDQPMTTANSSLM